MGRKLYVGNLDYSVDNAALEQLFAPFGAVRSVQIITDRATGQSKGFGFVEMGNSDEAEKATTSLHDKEFSGRKLIVNEAKPREERPRTGGFGGGGGGGGGGGRDRRERRY